MFLLKVKYFKHDEQLWDESFKLVYDVKWQADCYDVMTVLLARKVSVGM